MEQTPKKRLFKKVFDWISANRKLTIIASVVLAVTIIGLIIFFVFQSKIPKTVAAQPAVKTVTENKKKVETIKYYSPLTGKLVSDAAATRMPVTGIMIENSPDARPQSGLKNSGVVFEAIAEGGITRFLVLYQQEKPKMIGPVRSLRLYDVDWAAAFNCSIGHVGGSAAALVEVRNGKYRDIDQFFNAQSYWRATDRYAPHNVYTSFQRLDALNTSKGYTNSKFTGFTRTDGKAVETPDATNIEVTISSYLYNSSYVYDKKTNAYARSQAGADHLDREDGRITPSVVIVMYVDETTVLEDGYREKISTIGKGKAVIFQNGTAIKTTWYKTSKTSQITFKDTKGNIVPLVRGQTWITAVPKDTGGATWR